ncbi:hypothetical protein [Roseateles sp. LKC17W]|uniref:Uncharacterized protein n=1 Tax=Pelomonas margarita TaxID=3299031 RepID=A0ABW7FH11_9BURK
MGEQQAIAAAIKRASNAAQAAMQHLDERTAAELTAAYEAAAEQLRFAIAAAAQGQGRVSIGALQGLLAQVTAVLDALGTRRREVILAAIDEAAALGVEPLAAVDALVGVRAGGEAPAAYAQRAAEFVQEFAAADGLTLSDRLWRVGRGAREAVTGAIEQAVVRGWSADQAAQAMVMQGRAVPVATQAGQKAAAVDEVLRVADLLQDPAANPLASALRVARTEINRAHGEGYMASMGAVPGLVGFRFLLSPRHPRPDICDLLARQNLHGLGPGVYPDRKSCPWPAHPNTLSFVVAVMAHEVSDADRAGRETTLQALDRLGPDIRAGVLGPTKASYFDRRALTTGMVRSTVGAVRRRLEGRAA